MISKKYFNVAPGVWGMTDVFVNIYMIQTSDKKKWVLVDTGLKTSAHKIKKMAAALFGEQSRPKCIILTHGHFDHTGSLNRLAAEWNVTVYAHYLELPYLTDKSSYPPPDPTVGGGLMAWLSFLYPNSPIKIKGSIEAMPDDGSVPGLKEWQYIHTPGHAPGHISLYREKDKVLIAGDAFVTTKSESALSVMLQTKKISGPPSYLTYDWSAANDSVKKLLLLSPEVVATGHGLPMYGKNMRKQLHYLHEHFDQMAVPRQGRYVNEPAVADANGVMYVPPKPKNEVAPLVVAGVMLGLAASVLIIRKSKKKRFSLHF